MSSRFLGESLSGLRGGGVCPTEAGFWELVHAKGWGWGLGHLSSCLPQPLPTVEVRP